MSSVAPGCAELKIRDGPARKTWRILYRVDDDAVVLAVIFAKTSRRTPQHVIETARERFKRYDEERGHGW